MQFNSTHTAPNKLTFWVIWFAIFSGIFIIQVFAAGGFPSGENEGQPPMVILLLSIGAVVISTAIRWLVIPKIKQVQPLLTAMIIGLALAEGCAILGMFVLGPEFPQSKVLLFTIGAGAVFQYMPTYASRICDGAPS